MRPHAQAARRPFSRTPSLGGARLVLTLLAPALLLPACSNLGIRIPSGSATVVGVDTGARISPRFPTRAYLSNDPDTADIYLTDLTADQLTALFDDPAGSHVSGQLVHIHMFVRPKPGRTPIADTAISATIRYLIVADGRVGLYAGAGFLMPDATPGASIIGGSIANADLRLERATPGFIDRLGPSEMSISFTAKLDEPLADELHKRIEVLAQATKPVEGAEETAEAKSDD